MIERYAWNDDFALAVEEIRQAFPDEFSGAEIVDAEHAWIAFKGSPPAAARAIVDSVSRTATSASLEVRRDLGFSELELQAAIESVHFAVLRSPGMQDASTSYDYGTNMITTTVATAGAKAGSTVTNLTTTARDSLVAPAVGDLPGVSVTVVSSGGATVGQVDSSSYHYGGEILSTCTSGFGTRASSSTSGTRGISTAGHCGNSQSDDGSALTFKAQYTGTHGDFQWHTGPKAESDDFYAGSTTATETDLRDVSAVGSPVVGQSLCRNGKTNYKDCQ